MLKYSIRAICFIFLFLNLCIYGRDIVLNYGDGSLTLAEFLDSCTEAGQCTSSKSVPTNLPGKIITIKGSPYEIRYFSFEDTSGKLSPKTTFLEYVKQNNLLTLKSISTTPLPGIHFESFDFRRNPQPDGVYFSMAVRKIKNGDS